MDDFVSRCFLFTDKGLEWMPDTSRYPDERKPPEDERNSPPWTQIYIPGWTDHPGHDEQGIGISDDRPTQSLTGCVSRDRTRLVGWGCRKAIRIGQAWFDCLHMPPDLSEDYDVIRNRVVSRARLYFMDNDPDALLDRYLANFA